MPFLLQILQVFFELPCCIPIDSKYSIKSVLSPVDPHTINLSNLASMPSHLISEVSSSFLTQFVILPSRGHCALVSVLKYINLP